MQGKIQFTALIACAMLILPAAAFADNTSGPGNNTPKVNPQYLQAALASATCQVSLTTGYLQSVINLNQTTFASLNQDVTKLNGDLTTLQGYVSNNDVKGFQSFVQGQFKTDTRSANLDTQNLIKTTHLTKDQRATLKSEMLQLQSKNKSCMFAARQQSANVKVQNYQNQITHMQNRSKTLSDKGIDTTALNNQISGANGQVSSLQNAINSANDSKSLQKAINSFCLYDGCKKGTNFHFAANSAIAVKQAQLTKIQSRNGSSTYGTQITQAQSDLNAAQSVLNTVGNGQYSGTQQSTVWNDIKAATDIINQLWHELNHK